MSNVLKKVPEFQEQLLDFENHMSHWFNKKYCYNNDVRPFTFESDIWLLKQEYRNNDRGRLDFYFLSNVIYNKNDKSIMKCFFANMLMNGYSKRTVYNYYLILKKFYISTYGLSTVNDLSDDEIKNLCCEKNAEVHLYIPLKFIDFILDNNFYDDNYGILLKAKNKIDSIYISNYQESKSRDIPNNKDIAMFQYYLHKFETTEKDKDKINLFFPVIIWWRISTMIPVRPSEITYTLNKDCIFEINNACYIRLNRIKASVTKHLQIPIKKKICISKDLLELIRRYQELVIYDTKSITLFSISFLRNCFLALRDKDDFFINKANLFLRFYDDYTHFEASDLNQLIELFYEYYIDRQIVSPQNYVRLRAGDTRHLAFSSLLLQNLNPIDIAMMGGHTTLASLTSYVNHVDLYIDSEIYRYYNRINFNTETYGKRLKDIIMNMPFQSPPEFEKCIPDEYGVGYCTDRSFSCEDDLCFFCNKWWCRPTNGNFIKAAQLINNFNVTQLKKEMQANKHMLNTLLNKASVDLINGKLILKEEYYSQYRQLIKAITSNASRMEMLKEALLLNFSVEENNND